MKQDQHRNSCRARRNVAGRGQAMLEFIIVAALMLAVVMLMVDFGRALNYQQVMIGLSRRWT